MKCMKYLVLIGVLVGCNAWSSNNERTPIKIGRSGACFQALQKFQQWRGEEQGLTFIESPESVPQFNQWKQWKTQLWGAAEEGHKRRVAAKEADIRLARLGGGHQADVAFYRISAIPESFEGVAEAQKALQKIDEMSNADAVYQNILKGYPNLREGGIYEAAFKDQYKKLLGSASAFLESKRAKIEAEKKRLEDEDIAKINATQLAYEQSARGRMAAAAKAATERAISAGSAIVNAPVQATKAVGNTLSSAAIATKYAVVCAVKAPVKAFNDFGFNSYKDLKFKALPYLRSDSQDDLALLRKSFDKDREMFPFISKQGHGRLSGTEKEQMKRIEAESDTLNAQLKQINEARKKDALSARMRDIFTEYPVTAAKLDQNEKQELWDALWRLDHYNSSAYAAEYSDREIASAKSAQARIIEYLKTGVKPGVPVAVPKPQPSQGKASPSSQGVGQQQNAPAVIKVRDVPVKPSGDQSKPVMPQEIEATIKKIFTQFAVPENKQEDARSNLYGPIRILLRPGLQSDPSLVDAAQQRVNTIVREAARKNK